MNAKFYVPFETAKLLRKAGYPQESDYMYCKGEMHWRHLTLYQMGKINAVASPTYHEVVDWLSEKGHYIEVMLVRERSDLVWSCVVCGSITRNYPTREEAINAAIIKVLERI